ncbi:MAG: glycosyltransferase [Parcubacteria group bacterium]|nr:glycosyltransferase [Parcubacteria group bacterium]
MKICFLVNDLNIKAGWGRMAFDLINATKERGVDVEIILREEGFLKRPFFNFFKIRKIISDCDIIHAFDVWPFGFLASIYSIGFHKKIIISAIGTYSIAPLYNFFLKILSLWAYKRADKITAISDYTAKEIKKIIPNLNINVLPNGVNLEKWSNNKIGVFPEIFKSKPYILGVGGVKQRKGYYNSISAFAEITIKFPELKYVIVGQTNDEDYFNKLKNIISEHNLKDKVIFFKDISDEKLAAFYKNAELFILTPEEHDHQFEGFGLVYLEAAANGLPCIGSRKSGAETAIKEGVSGILVNQGNVHETALAIEKILGDVNFKNKLKSGAIEWARQNTWQKAMLRYFEIYEKSLENSKKVIITTSWDDGDVLDHKLVALLDKYGAKGTFYIASGRQNRLSDSEIAAISKNHEIGAHTVTHPHLTKIDYNLAKSEIEISKKNIEQVIKKPVEMFAYPFGDYNSKIKEAVRSLGFFGARTTDDWRIGAPLDVFTIGTTIHVYPHPVRENTGSVSAGIKPFLDNIFGILRYRISLKALFSWPALSKGLFDYVYKNGGVFHIWGHSWEIEKYKMWDDLENLLKYISSKDGVEFKTNGEII